MAHRSSTLPQRAHASREMRRTKDAQEGAQKPQTHSIATTPPDSHSTAGKVPGIQSNQANLGVEFEQQSQGGNDISMSEDLASILEYGPHIDWSTNVAEEAAGEAKDPILEELNQLEAIEQFKAAQSLLVDVSKVPMQGHELVPVRTHGPVLGQDGKAIEGTANWEEKDIPHLIPNPKMARDTPIACDPITADPSGFPAEMPLAARADHLATKPASATTTPQAPAVTPDVVNPHGVAPQPDTSNDPKIALKEQIKESVADLAFFADIENRLSAILDKYKDPKGEVKALRAETRHYVSALTMQCGEYRTEYVKTYGHLDDLDDPMLNQVGDLARQGRGQRAQPPTHNAEPRRTERRGERHQLNYRPAELRKRFAEELTVRSNDDWDAQSEGDSSMESDPKKDLTRHSNTAHKLHRKTKEFEAAQMLSDRDDDLVSMSRPSQQQFGDPVSSTSGEKDSSVISVTDELDDVLKQLDQQK